MAATTVSLKLLVDQESHRALFAEAGKDVVDFLFNILSFPLGTVIRLLNKQGMVGCLGDLYDSIENLADNYMQSTANKDTLLKPMVFNIAANVPLLLPDMNQNASFIGVAIIKPTAAAFILQMIRIPFVLPATMK
ncbi:Protein of unknown function DUF674 - like 3 [Theobroma cacao]|nr:Protein of unknown function DUF674 - like 3 [Theobroma cacao]